MTDDKDLLMRRVAAYLAVLIVIGFFTIMGLLAFKVVPPENKDAFTQMSGALILAFGGLMGYLYGTSKGAEAQNRAIAATALPAASALIAAAPSGKPGDPVSVTEVKP